MRLDSPRALALATAALLAAALPSAATSQSALDVAQAQAFMGSWTLSMTSDMGNFSMNLDFTDMGGKVGATLGIPDAGMTQPITDITKDGESLVLAFTGNAQGQVFDAVVTVEPPANGEISVWFDIGNGQFSMSGTGTKASG
jgi:hypothetical protein